MGYADAASKKPTNASHRQRPVRYSISGSVTSI